MNSSLKPHRRSRNSSKSLAASLISMTPHEALVKKIVSLVPDCGHNHRRLLRRGHKHGGVIFPP